MVVKELVHNGVIVDALSAEKHPSEYEARGSRLAEQHLEELEAA